MENYENQILELEMELENDFDNDELFEWEYETEGDWELDEQEMFDELEWDEFEGFEAEDYGIRIPHKSSRTGRGRIPQIMIGDYQRFARGFHVFLLAMRRRNRAAIKRTALQLRRTMIMIFTRIKKGVYLRKGADRTTVNRMVKKIKQIISQNTKAWKVYLSTVAKTR